MVSLAIIATSSWACDQEPLSVVEQGRYVEIATDRDTEICGGTLTAMDDYVALAFAAIGEVPPERIFVRYEWHEPGLDDDGRRINEWGEAQPLEDSSVVSTSRLMNEYALAQAVHQRAWPSTRPVLQEGFATLFSSDSGSIQDTWPNGVTLDPLLESSALDRGEYATAWFLVAQIVRDHGTEGLRELWQAVDPDASADQIRAAYQDLFAQPIDTLIEPREYYEGGEPLERWSCHYTVCAEPQPWEGDVWQAQGPTGCADDPHAIGPMGVSNTIERHHVVELEPGAEYRFTASGGAGAQLRPCGLQCLPLGAQADLFFPGTSRTRDDYPSGRYRVEIVTTVEELMGSSNAAFTIERLD